MNYKRLTLICGHYGSGKTNVALAMAFEQKRSGRNITLADLDIVNPYFRTKDSIAELQKAGIPLICSEYANTNVDIPALPPEMYQITERGDISFVLDIGGDDRGAYALGRLTDAIKAENNYDMLLVVNRFRPLTPDTASAIEVMREIEAACGIAFTGIVNNSNLGPLTTPEDVLESIPYAEDIARETGLPVVATTVKNDLFAALSNKVENLMPLTLQQNLSHFIF